MNMKLFFAILSLLLTAALATSAWSMDTTACHCFKDRSYNSADRFAADDYILATSFNSLMANAYDIPKKQIILLKMKGGAEHLNLIIGLRVATITGTDLQQILDYLKQGRSWQDMLSSPGMAKAAASDQYLAALAAGASAEEAGPRIADALLADFFKIPMEKVKQLRASGVNEKEMALIFILAHEKKVKPADLADLHLKEGKSWSQIADEFGIAPAEAGRLILEYTP